MFIPSTHKRTHQLSTGDVFLWDGHFYVVYSTARISASQTNVEAMPVNPADVSFNVTLMSDMFVQLYTWE